MNATRDPFDDIVSLVGVSDPIIVDGGANVGTVTKRFLQTFRAPTVYAIEPRSRAVSELRARFGDRNDVSILETALGSESRTTEIHITDSTAYSSLNEVDADKLPHVASEPALNVGEVIDTETVSVERLDELVEDVDVIKLDLQGYELRALRGSTDLLRNCSVIYTEFYFHPIYEEQPTFCELRSFLDDHGYGLYNIYDTATREDGRILGGDAIFYNES